jgi:hypothetical protein
MNVLKKIKMKHPLPYPSPLKGEENEGVERRSK